MAPDRVSYLPSELIAKIISRLSIREAVRTSVLSSEWRFKWATIPNLVFDDKCLPVASQDHSVIREKLARIIDRVLLLHSGPIKKFKLSHSLLIGVTDIDCWVLHISRRSVNKFVLKLGKGQLYRIPSCLFACHSLVDLKLHNCCVKLPSTFKGFRNLKSLDLVGVALAQDVFKYLISSCPLLERLKFWRFNGFNHLNIDAPNLWYLDIIGGFADVSFKNTVHLADVSIVLYMNPKGSSGSWSNLLKFFDDLPHVRRLEFGGIFFKYLAMGIVPLKLSKPCIDLDYFQMSINLKDSKEVSAALCLLRSSPNLQELTIVSRTKGWPVLGTDSYSWEDHQSYPFMQLKFVWIYGISGTKPELDFLKLLLTDSPVLENMTVTLDSSKGVESPPIELLQLWTASAIAEIVYIYS